MSKLSRRRFLQDSALLLAAASAPSTLLGAPGRGRRVGPNDKVQIAVIGLNGRGLNHVSSYAGMDDVVITALCDADSATFGRALQEISKRGKPAPKTFQDIRVMLDEADIDAVSIATTNHWHALGSIWAMQAGKDVYVEKPSSHNIFEGRQMVNAARKYRRICQVGTQSRSNRGMQEAIAFIHAGGIGKVKLARGLCYKRRPSIGRVLTPQAVPETVDYNLWLGPAPKKQPLREKFHYDWHWFWDYGNGDLGNQGSHEMDKARWGLQKSTLPKSAVSIGGRFGYRDNGETPNTIVTFYDYGDCELVFEVRGLPTEGLQGAGVGNIWYGEDGMVVAPSYDRAVAYDKDGKVTQEFKGGGDHYRNFVDAIRSRKVSDLNCDVEEGHLSAALCHMANISHRLGDHVPLSAIAAPTLSDDAEGTVERMKEHLANAGVNAANWSYSLGAELKLDPASEQFIGNDRANALAHGFYREPFVVREKV